MLNSTSARRRAWLDAAVQVPSVDNLDLPKGLPLKAGVGLDIAVHVRPLPGISSFLISTFPVLST